MIERLAFVLMDGLILWGCLMAISGFLYLGWHEPMYAISLYVVSVVLMRALQRLDLDPDIDP